MDSENLGGDGEEFGSVLIQGQIGLDGSLTMRDGRTFGQLTFINLPLCVSPRCLSKVSPVSATSLTVMECVKSLSATPAFRTVVTLRLWATQISGQQQQLHLTRIPIAAPHTLPLESLCSPRYRVAWTSQRIKRVPDDNKFDVSSWLHV